MKVLLIMIVCSAIAGLTGEVQGGEAPERPGVDRTSRGTTTDERGALATLVPTADATRAAGSVTDSVTIAPAASSSAVAHSTERTTGEPDGADRSASGLEPLVPGLSGRTFTLEPGPRSFQHRLSFSPAVGRLGDEPLYLLRVAYNPNEWLGWEAHLGHNKGRTVHALFHMLNAQVRYPVPFRVQPYLTGGFGVVLVFPGNSLNADPVTENAVAGGGGLELYLRNDLAVRGEWRRTSVFAKDRYTAEDAVYSYDEVSIGLSFYRRIGGS